MQMYSSKVTWNQTARIDLEFKNFSMMICIKNDNYVLWLSVWSKTKGQKRIVFINATFLLVLRTAALRSALIVLLKFKSCFICPIHHVQQSTSVSKYCKLTEYHIVYAVLKSVVLPS